MLQFDIHVSLLKKNRIQKLFNKNLNFEEEENKNEIEIDEIPLSPFFLKFNNIILGKNESQTNLFLINFLDILNQDIPFVEGDYDIFKQFSIMFMDQIKIKKDQQIAIYLEIFFKLQRMFRLFSNICISLDNLIFFSSLFKASDVIYIKRLIIAIFTEFLPVNSELVIQVFLIHIINIFNSYQNELATDALVFLNNFLTCQILTDKQIQQIINVMSFFSHQENNHANLHYIVLMIENLINYSKESFIFSFNSSVIKLIENLLMKASAIDKYKTLQILMFLTSIRYHELSILYLEFNLHILQNIIAKENKELSLLSIQCIHNFIIVEMAEGRFLENDRPSIIEESLNIANFFLDQLEDKNFDEKREIVFCLTHIIEFSSNEYKIQLLSNPLLVNQIIIILPALNFSDTLLIIKSLCSTIEQCLINNTSANLIKNSLYNQESQNVFQHLLEESNDEISCYVQKLVDYIST